MTWAYRHKLLCPESDLLSITQLLRPYIFYQQFNIMLYVDLYKMF